VNAAARLMVLNLKARHQKEFSSFFICGVEAKCLTTELSFDLV
jgi:hypothetical protein